MPTKKAAAPEIAITRDDAGGSVVQTGHTLRIRFGGKWITGISFPATVEGEKLATKKRHEIARDRDKMLTRSSAERAWQRKIERLTVQDAFQYFYKSCEEKKLSNSRLRSYELSWRQILQGRNYLIKREYSFDELRGCVVYRLEQDLRVFIREALERELTASTINTHVVDFSVILNYFYACHWLPEIDVMRYKIPAIDRNPVGLTDDEALLVIRHWRARDPDFGNLLRILRYLGRRYTESCKLKKTQYDFPSALIRIQSKSRLKKTQLFPITDELADIYYEQDSRYPDSDRLFPRYNNSHSSHAKKFKDSLQELGINLDQRIFEAGYAGGCFHVFRRTFAGGLNRAGASMTDLHEAMGHSDPRTTLKYYVERKASDLKDIVEKSYGGQTILRTASTPAGKRRKKNGSGSNK